LSVNPALRGSVGKPPDLVSPSPEKMETFIEARKLVPDPDYVDRRRSYVSALDLKAIDAPIVRLIDSLNKTRHCFTLQSCFGHFLYGNEKDIYNLNPLPTRKVGGSIVYRIAYIALCVENNEHGLKIMRALENISSKNPAYIQFGTAEWFWKKSVNSFIIQIEPERFKMLDKIVTNYEEAIQIEQVRNWFFEEIGISLLRL
jgi:hypothetical protein